MDPYVVFLHKHRDLVRRSAPRRIEGEDQQYTVLMASPILRELLMGKPSIVHAANDGRVKIQYTFVPLGGDLPVPEYIPEPDAVLFEVSADGFDPATCAFPGRAVTAKGERLLHANIGRLDDTYLTVKDYIDYTANTAGGTHFGDPTRRNREIVAALNEMVNIQGYEVVLYGLMAIGRVVAAGLQPLVDLLEGRD